MSLSLSLHQLALWPVTETHGEQPQTAASRAGTVSHRSQPPGLQPRSRDSVSLFLPLWLWFPRSQLGPQRRRHRQRPEKPQAWCPKLSGPADKSFLSPHHLKPQGCFSGPCSPTTDRCGWRMARTNRSGPEGVLTLAPRIGEPTGNRKADVERERCVSRVNESGIIRGWRSGCWADRRRGSPSELPVQGVTQSNLCL